MFQRVWIIPGKLAAEPYGTPHQLGTVIDPGIIILNSDFSNFDDAKERFCTVCNMTDKQLNRLRFKKAKTPGGRLLQKAAVVESKRRKAAALLQNT